MSDIMHIYYSEDLDTFLDYNDLDLRYDNRLKIEDINNFKLYMQSRNLWSKEFEEEFENYLRFCNN